MHKKFFLIPFLLITFTINLGPFYTYSIEKNKWQLSLFGSKLNSSLFELDTNFNETKISDEISSVLLNNEPRISNILVSVSNPDDSHELNVTIQYDITGISAPSQAVDVVLFPARV